MNLSHIPVESCSFSLSCFLKRTVPDPEPDVPEEELKHARDLWTTAVNADPLAVAVDMTNITACVESKARFTQLQYKADQYVEIEVFIRYSITDSIMECMFCNWLLLMLPGRLLLFMTVKGHYHFHIFYHWPVFRNSSVLRQSHILLLYLRLGN